jgi:uncharacterized protein YegL
MTQGGTVARRPGGPLATRPLYFFLIVDRSGSMAYDGKIQALNNAVKETLPHMRQAADNNANAEVFVRVLSFGDHPSWDSPDATPLSTFHWQDVAADMGGTSLGKALKELSTQLRMPPMPPRQLPPVILLISDGQPTDDFRKGLAAFMSEPWAKRAVRQAIAIGKDADRNVLQEFIGHSEIKPLEANNPEDLIFYLRWASTQALKSASSGGSSGGEVANPGANVPMPKAPDPTGEPDVW